MAQEQDLAEIGNFTDFKNGEQLAAYCGLVPSVYQSAGKLNTGHITKHGSPHIRRILIEVAHAISRTLSDSRLKKFYLRIKARRGAKVAIVALARKVICSLHHLIISREMFVDEAVSKSKRSKIYGSSSPPELNIAMPFRCLRGLATSYKRVSEPKEEDSVVLPPLV